MVIGQGAIADRFAYYALQSAYLIFAGTVHNSQSIDDAAIDAEEALMAEALATIKAPTVLVYFSSCSIEELAASQSPYVAHKQRMERLILSSGVRHLIFRLPQLIAPSGQGGLVDVFADAIQSGARLDVWKGATRNFIDIDDVYRIVHKLLADGRHVNQLINVASSRPTEVSELIGVLEHYFGRAGNYNYVERGTHSVIDVNAIAATVNELGIDFDSEYLWKGVNKYYAHRITSPLLLSVIIPTYNQSAGIDEFYRRTKAVLTRLAPRFAHELIFVNDFSADDTYLKLKKLAMLDPAVKVVNFARNFGNQIAITAGVDYCRGDLAVIIDDDLQDPPEIILDFIAKWSEGFKVVYGVRPKRQGTNFFFRLLAKTFYRLIRRLSDTNIPNDTGDFRLIDKVVIDQLRLMKEENRYYRGMVAWVGFPQTGYVYERDRRYAGTSNFSPQKYISFALNGLTSFTDKPLYFSSLFGFVMTGAAFVLALYLTIAKLLNPEMSIQGWTSMVVVMMFFGGIQLFSIGVLGIYISKIYREVKQRPLFIVQELLNIDENQPPMDPKILHGKPDKVAGATATLPE
ncbi:Glycosyltransferase involved in cell wall bisynthesis [Polaromonas sp. YR568]|nr:Glycosyltransferase involved in cell wall bisynthesis [Polaromonas sp. YR568]